MADRNKEAAKAFYDLMFNQYEPRRAVEEYVGIDIFRFDDRGKIVEHWDALQVVPAESKNDNTMF